jgi:carboxypeptidase Taq
MSGESAYARMSARAGELHAFQTTLSLLWWDEETGMPPKALPWRSRQVEVLSAHIHRVFSSAETGDLIAACEAEGAGGDTVVAANIRLWREEYDRATKLPPEFVAEVAATGTQARSVWAEARAKSDFSLFLPWLEKQVGLNRRKADYLGYEKEPYDALLNLYERGMKTTEARAVLGALQSELVNIVPAAIERSSGIPADLLAGDYPEAAQAAFNREVAEALGFDFDAGRIDTTTHPFCSRITPGDVRMTTRYERADFTESFSGVMHEMGHGLYEQGLPEAEATRPVGHSVSLGIHESQSRLWENHVGRSAEFWDKWLPVAAKYFPHLSKRTPVEMAMAMSRAQTRFIRVASDEATYDLHICLRFGLEVDMISGDLAPKDLPGEWNRRFKELTGLVVPDDAKGCLQDIHWSMGALGYFATYTLGNLLAAQLMESARRDPSMAASLDKADYGPLLGWLRKNIHAHGSLFTPGELIERATGKPLGPEAFLAHLRRRYTV